MADHSSFFGSLKDKLFGKSNEKKEAEKQKPKVEATPKPRQERKAPYLVQIGFDFGTSFSKCIYREAIQNQAWVYTSNRYHSPEQPFLIPSTIVYDGEKFKRHEDSRYQYPTGGLYHLKFALEKVALEDWNASVLNGYKKSLGDWNKDSLTNFVKNSAVFFLASSIEEILDDIKARFADIGAHPSDLIRINMAIPVADIERPNVKKLYTEILEEAWAIAPKLQHAPSIRQADLENLRHTCKRDSNYCFVYPEVSANVQAFINSPAANPHVTTIYLFSDTGAGTVDQSVFTYTRHNSTLNYFSANVWPIGSSHIELFAAQHDKNLTLETMESWRVRKENGDNPPQIQSAKGKIENQLAASTDQSLEETKRQLHTGPNVTPLGSLRANSRVIFGGGGHIDIPYKSGVMKAYQKQFHPDRTLPQIASIRTPEDLTLEDHQDRWWPRLYVAYGLSFLKENLTRITLPQPITVTQIQIPQKRWVSCTCRGINKSCSMCDGFGAYLEN